jgi:hypothetical protein
VQAEPPAQRAVVEDGRFEKRSTQAQAASVYNQTPRP